MRHWWVAYAMLWLASSTLFASDWIVEHSTPHRLQISVDFAVPRIDSVRVFAIVPSSDAFWLDDFSVLPYSSSQPAMEFPDDFQQLIRLRYYGQIARWHLAELVVYSGTTVPVARRVQVSLGFSSAYRMQQALASNTEIATLAAGVLPRNVMNPEAALWWYTSSQRLLDKLDGERWWKIEISQEGVYELTAKQLQSLGIALDNATLQTVKLYGIGGKPLPDGVGDAQQEWIREQPLLAEYAADGTFQRFVFYGAAARAPEYRNGEFGHYQNPYANTVTYLLTVGGRPRRPWTAINDSVPQAIQYEQQGIRCVFWEEDQLQLLYPGSGRNWVGMPFDRYVPATVTLGLPDLVVDSEVFYRFRLAHYASAAAEIQIYEHNASLATLNLASVNPAIYQYSVAYFRTIEVKTQAPVLGEPRSVLRLEYESSDPSGTGYIDWIDIWYTARLQARNGWIDFFTLPGESEPVAYVISGFQGDRPIWGFDVTDPAIPKPIAFQQYENKVRVDIQEQQPRRLVLAQQLQTPSVVPVELAGLRDSNHQAAVLVITHPQLLPSATAYADYRRQHDSLRCMVVTTESIFLEFAAGMPDPTAIRNFIALAFHQWQQPPQFVVFWGDGHYDYRQLQTSQVNFIPPWESPDNQDGYLNAVYSTVTEDFFVRVAGNDRANDLAIGRITVQSNEQGRIVLDKIQHYENDAPQDPWRLRVTLVADDSPTGGNGGDGTLHTSQSERLASEFIPKYMLVRKIYLPDYPAEKQPGRLRRPQVTADLLSSVNTGTAILNWIGHGNPRVWAHEEIFDKDAHIPQMQNRDRLFFLTAATCDFARFDDPKRQSGGEDLLVYPNGGAIAVFSSARAVYAFDNARLNERFYQELFTLTPNGYSRLGEVLLRVKHEFNSSNDEKFYLLGDPLVRVIIPPLQVRIKTINGIDMSQDSMEIAIPSLSTMTIQGSVVGLDQSRKFSFQGIVQAFLFDADVQKEAIDVDGTKHRFMKPGGLLNVGAATVREGKFTVTIVVPKDVSFSKQPVKLLLYAIDTTHKWFAKGISQQYRIQGIGSGDITDTQGPQIEIFLESLNFRPCDSVSVRPLLIVKLFDSTGINASGIGVGHDIQAWIDDNPLPLVLTPYYQPSLQDARRGRIETFLPRLSPGKHTLRIRAWDIVGNVSDQTICFVVADLQQNLAKLLTPYPQPFQTSIAIPFQHFSDEPVEATIRVFDQYGRVIWEKSQVVAERVTAFHWQPEPGTVAGVYGYQIQIRVGQQTQSIGGTIVYKP